MTARRAKSLGKTGDQIASVIGWDLAFRLIAAAPVTPSRPWRKVMYIPARMPIGHWIVASIGFREAERLAYAFGGEVLQTANTNRVIRAVRDDRIADLSRDGMTAREIALHLDMPRQTVVEARGRLGLA